MTMTSDFTPLAKMPRNADQDCWMDLRDTAQGYEIRSEWQNSIWSALKRSVFGFCAASFGMAAVGIAATTMLGQGGTGTAMPLMMSGALAIASGAFLIAARKPSQRAVVVDQVGRKLDDTLSGPNGIIIQNTVDFADVERLVARRIQDEPARYQLMAAVHGQPEPLVLAYGTKAQIEMLRLRMETDMRMQQAA